MTLEGSVGLSQYLIKISVSALLPVDLRVPPGCVKLNGTGLIGQDKIMPP